MRLLVTGGAGFIGSAVIRQLIRSTKHSVVNVDNLTYAGNLESLAETSKNQRYIFELADITDRKAIDSILDKYKPNAIMHLAAESHVDRSIAAPANFIQTNVVGTYTLLEATRSYWLNMSTESQNAFRFHHISTDEVYGDLQDTKALFTESSIYNPNSPYSASKAASDHLVRAWQRTYGLPTLISNCSNNYGQYQFPEKLIPHVILNALHGKTIPIYGDGQQIRDWLFVEDHARALIKVVTEGVVGETYNIGGYNERCNLTAVEMICDLLEQLVPERKVTGLNNYRDLIEFVKDRPGHDVRYAIDASKIKNELGWLPEETFESGLHKTVQWYLDNEQWWQRVLSGSYHLERIGESVELEQIR